MKNRNHEFETDIGGETISSLEGRQVFLQFVNQLNPEVSRNLLESCGPELLQLTEHSESGFDRLVVREQKKFGSELKNVAKELAEIQTLKRILAKPAAPQVSFKKSVMAWAKRWNLSDPWCIEFAVRVLWRYTSKFRSTRANAGSLPTSGYSTMTLRITESGSSKAWQSTLLIDLRLESAFLLDEATQNRVVDDFTFKWKYRIDGRNTDLFVVTDKFGPHVESSNEFRERLEGRLWQEFLEVFPRPGAALIGRTEEIKSNIITFEKSLKHYIGKTREMAVKDTAKVKKKRTGNRDIDWLVQYQVPLGKSFNQLASEFGIDRKAVERAVKETAEHIGLTLRAPTRPGRPRRMSKT
jgi:hypothetical protein